MTVENVAHWATNTTHLTTQLNNCRFPTVEPSHGRELMDIHHKKLLAATMRELLIDMLDHYAHACIEAGIDPATDLIDACAERFGWTGLKEHDPSLN